MEGWKLPGLRAQREQQEEELVQLAALSPCASLTQLHTSPKDFEKVQACPQAPVSFPSREPHSSSHSSGYKFTPNACPLGKTVKKTITL